MPDASNIYNVSDARTLARRVLPKAIFDYVDGAAEGEVTAAENEKAFNEIAFRPRMAVRVERPVLGTSVVGTEIALPVIIAPCGLVGVMHPDGAVGVARAARRAGTISVLSTVAGVPPEELDGEPGPRWFQLYAANRAIASDLMERAKSSGFDGLVVTVDTPALGKRERDLHHGVTGSFALSASTAMRLGPQIIARPTWALRMARRSIGTMRSTPLPGGGTARKGAAPHSQDARQAPSDDSMRGNGAQPQGAPKGAVSSAGAIAMLASPFTWEDVAWMRDRWRGPLLVKGILGGEDATLAADSGADAVIVSNHGGRQLEGAPATLRVLPEVVRAVGNRVDVLVDGGVRRGGDVVKALALGAKAVLIGRAYLYAFAAAGEAGVERMLEIFSTDTTRTLSLMGCGSVTDLGPQWLQRHGPLNEPILP